MFFRWIIVRGQMYSNIKYGVVMAIKDSMWYLIPQFSFLQGKFLFWPLNFLSGQTQYVHVPNNNQVLEQWNIDNLWAHDLIFNDFFLRTLALFIHVPPFLLTQSWNYLLHHCECPIHIIYTFVIHKRPFSFVRSMSSIHSLTLKIGSSFSQ